MKILFTCTASHSHFAPLVPLARAIQARGHEVRFAALPKIADEITRRGFGHLPMEGPTEAERAAFSKRVEGTPMSEAGRIYVAEFFMRVLGEPAARGLRRALADWRPDLVIRETLEMGALVAAEELGIRHVRLEIINGETEEKNATDFVAEYNALRAALDLSPVAPGYLREEVAVTAHPQALDPSRRVNTMAPIRFLAEPVAPAGSGASEWKSDDRPLIYATFGTVAANGRANVIYQVAADALADVPARVLFTTGRDAPADLFARIPENVTVRPFVPQAEVLPHAALMLCHGGSGTVIAGLAQGVPMVIAPLFADQPYNAQALEAGGLCRAVHDATVETLRAAVLQALEDEAMHRRAREVAAEISRMPTVGEVADRLIAS